MNKRILSVVLVAFLAVAMIVGAVVVSAADGVNSRTTLQDKATNGRDVYLTDHLTDSMIGQSVEITRDMTIDLNGWDIVNGTIEVKPGVTLTIVNSYKDKTHYVNAVELEGKISPDGKTVTTAKLVADGVIIKNVTAKQYSDVTVKNVPKNTGMTLSIAKNATATVESGEAVVVTGGIADAGKVTITGGNVSSINYVTATVTGGKVGAINSKATAVVNGATAVIGDVNNSTVVLNKGTINGTISADSTITVDGRDVYGAVVNSVAPKGAVTVINGYVKVTKDDDGKVTQTKAADLADKYAAVAEYTDEYIDEVPTNNKANKLAKTKDYYVYGVKTIENLTLDSYAKFMQVSEGTNTTEAPAKADKLHVIVNPDDEIELKVAYAAVDVTKEADLKNKVIINGYELGSKLQPGKPIHDWATTVTPATEEGKRDCSKKYVLQPYYEDKLAPNDYWGKPDADGKLADIYNTAADKDGAVVGEGHSYKFVSAKAATAKEPGYDAYLQCKHCGKYFAIELAGADNNTNYKVAEAYEIESPIARNPVADTTAAPAETTAAPAETTAAPAETTAAPAETTAAPETQAPTPVNPSETGDNGMNALVWVIVLGAAITGVAVAGKSVLASKKH